MTGPDHEYIAIVVRAPVKLQRLGGDTHVLAANRARSAAASAQDQVFAKQSEIRHGSQREYSRGTLDRGIRAYREQGLDGLRPEPRSDLGEVRRHPELLKELADQNTRAGQDVLRAAIQRCGLPERVYVDNGAPYANAALERSCAGLGIHLIQSRPYSPEGRGKQ